MPEMRPVTSSNIERVGYDPAKREMHVAFKGGNHYIFDDVPPEEHAALMAAESAGKHFHANVKGKYKQRRPGEDTG